MTKFFGVESARSGAFLGVFPAPGPEEAIRAMLADANVPPETTPDPDLEAHEAIVVPVGGQEFWATVQNLEQAMIACGWLYLGGYRWQAPTAAAISTETLPILVLAAEYDPWDPAYRDRGVPRFEYLGNALWEIR